MPPTSTSVTTVYLHPQPPCSRRLTTWRGDRGRALNCPLPLTCSSSQKKLFLHFNPQERTWQWLWTVAVLSWFSLSPLGKRCHVCGHGQKRSEVELKLPTRGYRRAELGHTQSWSHDQAVARPWELSRGAVGCLGEEPTAITTLHGHQAKQVVSGGPVFLTWWGSHQ